ncbi:hypothetical protein GCM10008013_44380 [Paenibacillus segetis]|uniref:Sulfatase N-terminal domain-containing protein n=2 Tax=Paenibacillus segetis TaxID=1325360 RepID=A0ABQ1YTB9_9BACL|nr:hypothetical protein GCM10008013_44380 [Paenibacillus segetis]
MLVLLCFVELLLPNKGRWNWLGYFGFNLIISFILFAATLYFAYFGTVPTYRVLSGLNQVPEVGASVSALIKPQQFLFFVDLLILFIWKIVRRSQRSTSNYGYSFGFGSQKRRDRRWLWKAGISALMVVSILISGLYIASGKDIDNELVRAEKVGFLNYQVDALLRNQEEERKIAEGNLQETITKIEQLQSTYPYRDNANTDGQPQYFGAAKGKNLIVVQMESFQNFPIHLTVDGQEVTPVLNGLAKEGIYFPYLYQQIGQGNTSDAEFMSNTSIYPTGTIAMSTGFGSRELPSLPRLLQNHGYEANTFHINDVTFWDRNKLYPALHFDKYYDKPYYENDHFNDFGASDEEMYRVGVEKLQKLKDSNQLFYAQFVTTSSHSPFIVPKDRQHMTLPADLEGTSLGNYLLAANYTDYAIGTLVQRLKDTGMWDNTMLVFYGDHFGVNSNETSAAEITSKLGVPYDDKVSRFNIPFIVHIPGQNMGVVSERSGGQVDMLPTIANLLGVSLKDEQFTALGQDLLNIDRNVFGMRYYLPTGSFFNDEIMFVPGKGFEDGTATSLRTLEPIEDFSAYRQDYDYVTQLMKLSDEYVNLLPKRH